jgi:flagellar FliL protein
MAKPAKPAAAAAEAPAKPKNKKMVLAIIAVVILGAAGGGGWYFMKGSKPKEEHKVAVVEEPMFIPLDPFAVNLQHEENDQCMNSGSNMNVGLSLKVTNSELAEKIRQHMPEIRSRLLFLLSSKKASELMPVQGKKKLIRDIVSEISNILKLQIPIPKIAEHEAPKAEAVSAVEGGHGEGAPAVAAVPEAEVHGGEGVEGPLDVLFTAFLIGS